MNNQNGCTGVCLLYGAGNVDGDRRICYLCGGKWVETDLIFTAEESDFAYLVLHTLTDWNAGGVVLKQSFIKYVVENLRKNLLIKK